MAKKRKAKKAKIKRKRTAKKNNPKKRSSRKPVLPAVATSEKRKRGTSSLTPHDILRGSRVVGRSHLRARGMAWHVRGESCDGV